MPILRRVVDGVVIWTDGKTNKKVPTRAYCREKLSKLIEEDKTNKGAALKFWLERSKAMGSDNELEATFAKEVWHLLDTVWEELKREEAEPVDIFASLSET